MIDSKIKDNEVINEIFWDPYILLCIMQVFENWKNKEISNNLTFLIEDKIIRYLSKEEDKIIEILIIW